MPPRPKADLLVKKTKNARTVMLQVRISHEEHATLKTASKHASLTLSGWARSRLIQNARVELNKEK